MHQQESKYKYVLIKTKSWFKYVHSKSRNIYVIVFSQRQRFDLERLLLAAHDDY